MNKSIILLPLTILCLVALSCAKTPGESTGKDAQERLSKWMNKYHPGVQPTEDGLYILTDEPGDGALRNEELPYVIIRGTIRTLEGTVSSTTEEAMARQIGKYGVSNYYGPQYQYLSEGYSYAGMDILLRDMRVGGHRVAVIPSWMLTSSRYSTQAEYINACTSSTHLIYDVTLVGQSADAEADGIVRVMTYVSVNYPGTESVSYIEDAEPDNSFYFISDVSAFDEENKLSDDASVKINYTGKMLNGTVFDTTIRKTAVDARIDVDGKTYEPQSVTFSSSYSDITMGDSSSLISGFKGALSLMHWKGQKATVVFSSAHGYGASGSSNSNGFVIPPYEPLIFELEILQDEEAE